MRKCGFLSRTVRFITLANLLTACASLPPGAQDRPDTTVNAPVSRTWDAVVDYFARSSIPIKTIDRASGIIAAETTLLGGETKSYGVCVNGIHEFPPVGASFNVLVRGDSARSIVRVTASWFASDRGSPCVSSDVWEKNFEGAIRGRAEATH